MDEITHQISRNRSREGREYGATYYGDGTSYDGMNRHTLRTAYYGNTTPSTAKTGNNFGTQISNTNGLSHDNIYFGNNGTAYGRKNNEQNSYNNGNKRPTTLTNNGAEHYNQSFDTANYGYSHVPFSNGFVATVGTEYKQTLTNNANYYGYENGTIYDVNCANEQYNVLRASVYPNVNGTPSSANGVGQCSTAYQQYYDNTAWGSIANVQNSHETVNRGHGSSSCRTAPSENTTAYRQYGGPEQTTNGRPIDTWTYHKESTQSQVKKEHGHFTSTAEHTTSVVMSDQTSRSPPRADDSVKQEHGISPKSKAITDVTSRKRKLPDDTTPNAEINDNDVTSPTIDKRALYSKFRVVKKSDKSPTCNESSKVKPFLRQVKLGDKTTVEVNDKDGLPNYAKMSKIISTVTPLKENEADATIGNIEFITLANMKVVRRKLEVVLAVQQENDARQERLRLEAEVKAKVKANVKSRSRKDRKRKERARGHRV